MKAKIISYFALSFVFSITAFAQTFSLKYSFDTSDPLVYVGDIDGDNIAEFVEMNAYRPDTLYIYSGTDGTIKYSIFGKGSVYLDMFINFPPLIDFNKNGVKDFYIRSYTKLYIVDPSSGQTLFEYTKKLSNSSAGFVAVADFDNDKKLDLLVSEQDDTYGSYLVKNFVYSTDVSVTAIISDGNNIGTSYKLYNNYPNPFNSSTIIKYQIPEPGLATINIYNINGVLIRKISQQHSSSGDYSIIWDGKNNFGEKVSSNVYFYQLVINNHQDVKKIIMLK